MRITNGKNTTKIFLLFFAVVTFLYSVDGQCNETLSFQTPIPAVMFPKLNIISNGEVIVRYILDDTKAETTVYVKVSSSMANIQDLNNPTFLTSGSQMDLTLNQKSLPPPSPPGSSAGSVSMFYSLCTVIIAVGLISGQRPIYLVMFVFLYLCCGTGLSNASMSIACPISVDVIIHPLTYESLDVVLTGSNLQVDCSMNSEQLYGAKCYSWVSTYVKSFSSPDNPTICNSIAGNSEYTLVATSDYFYILPDLANRIDPQYLGLNYPYMQWTYKDMTVTNWGQSFASVSIQSGSDTCEFIFTCKAGSSCDVPSSGKFCGLPTKFATDDTPLNCTTPNPIRYCPTVTQCEYSCNVTGTTATCGVCDIGNDTFCSNPTPCSCRNSPSPSNSVRIVVGIWYFVVMSVILLLQIQLN
jgi:hypothetical protein